MFLPVPYKVQRIIATDLNRLDVEAGIALKCASVLCVGGGQVCLDFDLWMLCAVFPHDGGRPMTTKLLESHVDTLVQFGCVVSGVMSYRRPTDACVREKL